MSELLTLQPAALDKPTAAKFVLLSESTIDELMQIDQFPKPRQLSPKKVAWLVRDLVEWLEATPPVPDRTPFGPVTTDLYRHFDVDGNLLYVGISLSAIARLCQHRMQSHWSSQITRVTVEKFDSREEADAAETQAIRTEFPLHNLAKRGCK